jgi:hypothetical protein
MLLEHFLFKAGVGNYLRTFFRCHLEVALGVQGVGGHGRTREGGKWGPRFIYLPCSRGPSGRAPRRPRRAGASPRKLHPYRTKPNTCPRRASGASKCIVLRGRGATNFRGYAPALRGRRGARPGGPRDQGRFTKHGPHGGTGR